MKDLVIRACASIHDIPKDIWPECCIPGCTNRICLWANDPGHDAPRCYPHLLEVIGLDEMNQRYQATHPEYFLESNQQEIKSEKILD